MKRIGILVFWMLASGSTMMAQVPSRKATPPDVFLITIDTLRADHVHCYGYDKIATPAIDGLAKDGIRFSQAFTPSPITNTSHTTILTGLLPSTHGVTDFAIPLAATHPTWAELLSAQGYHTAAFIGAVILDSKSLAPGLDRGFDFYDNFPEHSKTKARWGRVERRGMDVVQRAEAWLTAHPRGPRFVWVHLYDPHDPYEPPPPYSTTYEDRLYDGEVAYADSALGNFLAYLKAHNWYQNALIIVVGDHGEGLGEHHEETHGIFLYDATTHVPLLFKLPGRPAAKVIDAQVRTTDILPTVLDIVGAQQKPQLDGESVKAYFTGEAADRTAFGETDYPMRFGWAPLRSVRTPAFKFIEAPRPELYDLHADPRELRNTFREENPEVRKSRALLADLRAKLSPASSGQAGEMSSTAQSNSSQLLDPKDKIEEQNLLHRAMIAAEDDQSADARKALEKVLEMDPKSQVALRQLGELELQAGDYSQAAGHLKSALQIRPDDATVAYGLGQALAKTGDLEGARDAMEASLKVTPGQTAPRILLGNVYLELRDLNAAEDQFEAVLLSEPNSAEAKAGLAKVKAAKK
jgi:arylsulfatase A-like enzyme/lipoprotein NlpI